MTFKPEFEVGKDSPAVWKEVRRLEAENIRLREALTRITGPWQHTRDSFLNEDFTAQFREAQAIAQAALDNE